MCFTVNVSCIPVSPNTGGRKKKDPPPVEVSSGAQFRPRFYTAERGIQPQLTLELGPIVGERIRRLFASRSDPISADMVMLVRRKIPSELLEAESLLDGVEKDLRG